MNAGMGEQKTFRLVVVRHGATQHNLDGRMTGQIDAPLSPLGRRQAHALAVRLATWSFDEIVASDLARARETADMIAAELSMPVRLDADLREIDMGSWSGKPYRDWTAAERTRFVEMERDPTGRTSAPDGESCADLAARINEALARSQARHPGGSVLWVAHGGVLSALLVQALHIGFDQRGQFRRGNCSISELLFQDSRVTIGRLNDTSHLEALEAEEPGEVRQAL